MTPSHLTRRSFLAGGTAGLCLASLTDLAAAATPLNMQLGWLGGGNHARPLAHPRELDRAQLSMGVGAAQEGDVQHPRSFDIVDKQRPAGE